MSELRIALVAEGPTDAVIIEAALKAILGRSFIIQVLQPEETRPALGSGWCGVLKWCRESAAHAHAGLEMDPTLPGFDLFVIHVDSDVAEKRYEDGGEPVVELARGLPDLPCSKPCPPAAAAADEVRERIVAWLGLKCLGPRTVLCVPSKAVEAWLAAGVLQPGAKVLRGLECNLGLEGQLAVLPVGQRIRKTMREYRRHAATVSGQWRRIVKACGEAERFQREVSAALTHAS